MHYFNFLPCSRYGRNIVRNENLSIFQKIHITYALSCALELDCHNQSICKEISKESHLKKRKSKSSNFPSCLIPSICQTSTSCQLTINFSSDLDAIFYHLAQSRAFPMLHWGQKTTSTQLYLTQPNGMFLQRPSFMKGVALEAKTHTSTELYFTYPCFYRASFIKTLSKFIFFIGHNQQKIGSNSEHS